jgi:hypothetical protein
MRKTVHIWLDGSTARDASFQSGATVFTSHRNVAMAATVIGPEKGQPGRYDVKVGNSTISIPESQIHTTKEEASKALGNSKDANTSGGAVELDRKIQACVQEMKTASGQKLMQLRRELTDLKAERREPVRPDTKDARSRSDVQFELKNAEAVGLGHTNANKRIPTEVMEKINRLKEELKGTKDAALTESQFKTKVGEINSVLTDAARKCESLSNQLDADGMDKCEKLENLIDAARKYAFQIR